MAGRGPICAVSGCRNYRIQRDQKSFYRFPKNKELCTQWVMKSNRPDLDEILKKHGPEHLNKNYVVCSDHFHEKDFRNRLLLSQGIWPGAVPSLSLPNAADTISSRSPKKRKREDCEAEYTSNVVEDASVSEKQLTEPASRRIAKTCCSEMLEVPGHFQKPHQIFISEKADWSFENTAQEETDPLCLEEEQDCKDTTREEERPMPWRLTKVPLPVEHLAEVDLPPPESSVKLEKVHHSTTVSSHSTRNMPVSESPTNIGNVTTESYADDTGTESFPRVAESVAAVEQEVVICPAHTKTRIRYSQMIIMAMIGSPNWRIKLSEIYVYASKNIPANMLRGNWQNSIRHILSVSPLFVKAEPKVSGKGHYWTVDEPTKEALRQHFAQPRPAKHCCAWQLVSYLQRLRAARTPAGPQPTHAFFCPLTLRPETRKSSSPTRKIEKRSPATSSRVDDHRKSSSPTRKVDIRSPATCLRVGRHARIPRAGGRREPACPKPASPFVQVDVKAESEEEAESKAHYGPAPPLKPLIARAIMLSPNRHVPLTVIYTYCMRHCPYYRNNRRLCQNVIKGILATEACFKRLPRDDNSGTRPDYWTFDEEALSKNDSCLPWNDPDDGTDMTAEDTPRYESKMRPVVIIDMQYNDLSERNTSQTSSESAHTAPPNAWDHDHGLYPKKSPPDTNEASDDERDVGSVRSPDSQATDTASEPGSDNEPSNPPLCPQLQWAPPHTEHSRGGAARSKRSSASTQRTLYGPRSRPLRRHDVAHSDYPFPDRPVDVRDAVDIKEEPFPEEVPMEGVCTEGKGDQRQNKCSAVLNADCYRPVKIKKEKKKYPAAVKYEMVYTRC